MTREKAISIIRASAADPAAQEKVISGIMPCVRILPERTLDCNIPLGASKFGGNPHLPEGWSWPTWQTTKPVFSGKKRVRKRMVEVSPALSFIAQFRMADVARHDIQGLLPANGILFFFYDLETNPWGYDPAHRGGWRILYYDGEVSSLKPVESPVTNPEWLLQPCLLRFEPGWTPPDTYHAFRIGTDDPNYEPLQQVQEQLAAPSGSNHYLLGLPTVIQDEMPIQCQLASNGLYCGDGTGYNDPRARVLAGGVADWTLLLQVDTDESTHGREWGDSGTLYFWIRKQDLEQLDFSQVWFVWQEY